MTAGDVITGVNGQAVTSEGSLTTIMSKFRSGSTISLTWVGINGQKHTSSITLIQGPAKYDPTQDVGPAMSAGPTSRHRACLALGRPRAGQVSQASSLVSHSAISGMLTCSFLVCAISGSPGP